MRTRKVGVWAIMGIGVACAGSAGCNWMLPLAMATAPHSQKIPPEYAKLPGRTAAVVVIADQETLYDYPNVRLELSSYVTDLLKSRVRDARFIAPRRIEDFLQSEEGSNEDPQVIGRHFDADMVIQVMLLEFSMRDPELATFCRGRITASVTVFDLTDPNGVAQRTALKDVEVVYPTDRPVGYEANMANIVRQKTYEAFADAVGRKFYEYEKEI